MIITDKQWYSDKLRHSEEECLYWTENNMDRLIQLFRQQVKHYSEMFEISTQ